MAAAKKKVAPELPWQQTLVLLKAQQDPVAQKLANWIYVTETDVPVDPRALAAFIIQNPDWPKLHRFRAKLEKEIGSSFTPTEINIWFQSNPPETADGLHAMVDALVKTGQPATAQKTLAGFWPEIKLSKNETATLAGHFKNILPASLHAQRLDELIWQGRLEEADTMLAFVGQETRALGYARIALAKNSKGADKALAAVPASMMSDEGLLFERMRYRRRKDMDAGALQILDLAGQNQKRPEIWWKEINILARRALEDGNPSEALRIAKKHQMTSGAEFAQAEWLIGWLYLRALKQPAQAYRHFDGLYKNVQSAISRSRAAYWAARAAENIPDHVIATEWDKVAAGYSSTFYGQLSHRKLYGSLLPASATTASIPPERQAAFNAREPVRAARLLHKSGLGMMTDPFHAKLLMDAKDKTDYALAARLARETGRTYYAVEANKQAQQALGVYLFEEGYPLFPSLPEAHPEKALVHAIVYRESMFDQKALSSAGARGLMQLMPATAKMMSKKKGLNYRLDKLTEDPRFNLTLGSVYLESLVNNYGGFYPMAIAAYNAGPGRVREWIDTFGDPRKGEIDIIEWVENIPIYETRNYVQRVMESYYIYRIRLNQPPRTIFDFVPANNNMAR